MKRNLPNNSICSLAQFFGDSIALVDNEILIKDLEDLAALEIRHCNASACSRFSSSQMALWGG